MKYTKLLRSKIFWACIVFFIIMSGVSLHGFLKFWDENYVGPLMQVSSGSLLLDDRRKWETLILYDAQTEIIPEGQSFPEIGTPVFISTDNNSDGTLQAKFIRTLQKWKLKN